MIHEDALGSFWQAQKVLEQDHIIHRKTVLKKIQCRWMWWHMPVILALRWEDGEFQASLGCIERTCSKKRSLMCY
jgi:hypothetical protein